MRALFSQFPDGRAFAMLVLLLTFGVVSFRREAVFLTDLGVVLATKQQSLIAIAYIVMLCSLLNHLTAFNHFRLLPLGQEV